MAETINIYWAPLVSEVRDYAEYNMLFGELVSLYEDKLNSRQKTTPNRHSFFACPVSSARFKRIVVFKNGLHSKYKYHVDEKNEVIVEPLTNPSVNFASIRTPTATEGPIINYGMRWILFADQPVIGQFNSPHFHKAPHLQYGSLIPASFDIGQWFRPIHLEFQLWQNAGEFELQIDEPVMYLELLTDKKIQLHRFDLNGRLNDYMTECVNASKFYGSQVPVVERYKRFTQSRMKERILREISAQLLE